METDLTLNFLAKQRAPRQWRFSYRYVFYALLALALLFILYQQRLEKSTLPDNSLAIKKRQTREQFNDRWGFLENFFSVLNNELPDTVHISEVFTEQDGISLQGQAVDADAVNTTLLIFKKKLPNTELHLTSVDEKNNLNFSFLIDPKQDFSLLENDDSFTIKNSTLKNLLRNAQQNELHIDSLKPKNSTVSMQVEGNYSGILQFLSALKKDHFSLTSFDIKPSKHQLELDAELNVVTL